MVATFLGFCTPSSNSNAHVRWRWRISFFVAVLLATSLPLHAQPSPDSLVRLQRSFYDFWLREWVLSESSRHPVVNTYSILSGRKYNTDGTITFRVSGNGAAGDSVLLLYSHPKSRHQAISECRRVDHIRSPGVGPQYEERVKQNPKSESLDPLYSYRRTIIMSSASYSNLCPAWYLGTDSLPPWDERLSVDAAIVSDRQNAVRTARSHVIAGFLSAHNANPSDDFILGQLVLLLAEQQQLDSAQTIVNACRAEQVWCFLLKGFVAAKLSNMLEAEYAFDSALVAMTTTQRCAWSDVSLLLTGAFKEQYLKLPCSAQDSVNKHFWWLSDPAWTSAGNDRRAEHFARKVLAHLKLSAVRDERFDWRPIAGGDARREMLVRYGWPSFSFWRGITEDSIREQGLALQSKHTGVKPPPNAPFVSYEYSAGRVHSVPDMRALWGPFQALASDWSLMSTPGGDTVLHFTLPHTIERNLATDVKTRLFRENTAVEYAFIMRQYPHYQKHVLWWPQEHYPREQRLYQIANEGQTAMLRRANAVIVAHATSIEDANGHGSFTLISSDSPESSNTLDKQRTDSSGRIALAAALTLPQTLLGIESTEPSKTALWRTRFGITLPRVLDSTSHDSIAVSKPILLRRTPNSIESTASVEGIKELISTSLTVERGSPLTIYWEVYGNNDSAETAVRMEAVDPRTSAIRRLGELLGFGKQASVSTQIRWRDDSENTRVINDGRHRISLNTVVLSTKGLPVGKYDLQVSTIAKSGLQVREAITVTIK